MHRKQYFPHVCPRGVLSRFGRNGDLKFPGRLSRSSAPVQRGTVAVVLSLAFLSVSLTSLCDAADGSSFDLPGPRIDITVTRAGKTLPISEVPNLEAGDRLWLHPDIPETQSAHYLLVTAFLRGST